MTGSLRSFQESVINRMVERRDRKLLGEGITTERFLENMENVVTESVQRGDEVKMNFRFLNKSFHVPIVHIETSDITSNPKEIKRKDANFHLCTSRLLQYRRRSGGTVTVANSDLSLEKMHDDSAIKGVLVAMDYDTDLLGALYHHSDAPRSK